MKDMQRHLRDMFEDVRRFLVCEGLGRLDVVQMNAKGDVTKEFDFLAEARIIEWCRQAIAEPVRILTEERGEVRTRPGRAAWTLIVDPVDGSENFARGNECSSVSLAALPGDEIPHPDAVFHALVGRIFGGTSWRRSRETVRGAMASPCGRPRCSGSRMRSSASISSFRTTGTWRDSTGCFARLGMSVASEPPPGSWRWSPAVGWTRMWMCGTP